MPKLYFVLFPTIDTEEDGCDRSQRREPRVSSRVSRQGPQYPGNRRHANHRAHYEGVVVSSVWSERYRTGSGY